jgi:hypothetical protein
LSSVSDPRFLAFFYLFIYFAVVSLAVLDATPQKAKAIAKERHYARGTDTSLLIAHVITRHNEKGRHLASLPPDAFARLLKDLAEENSNEI